MVIKIFKIPPGIKVYPSPSFSVLKGLPTSLSLSLRHPLLFNKTSLINCVFYLTSYSNGLCCLYSHTLFQCSGVLTLSLILRLASELVLRLMSRLASTCSVLSLPRSLCFELGKYKLIEEASH